MNLSTLVLNNSYLPLAVVPWSRAISLVFSGKASVEHEYDEEVHSPSLTMRVPSVIRMNTNYFYARARIRLTSKTIFERDKYTCQYCGVRFNSQSLNLDHVHPQSRGGEKNWHNIVTSCIPCNTSKGNKTPQEAGMTLLSTPGSPHYTIYDTIMRKRKTDIPEAWKNFLMPKRQKDY